MNISNDQMFAVSETLEELDDLCAGYMKSHRADLERLLDDPSRSYETYWARFQRAGINAAFPEFESIMGFLHAKIKISLLTINDPSLTNLAYLKIIRIMNVSYAEKQVPFPYGETLRVIADVLE